MIKTLALIIFNFKKLVYFLPLLFDDLSRFLTYIGDDVFLLPRIMMQLRRAYVVIEEHKTIVFIIIVVIIVSVIIWKKYYKNWLKLDQMNEAGGIMEVLIKYKAFIIIKQFYENVSLW